MVVVQDTSVSSYVYLVLTHLYTLSRSLIQFVTLRIPYYTFATLSWATTLTFRLTTFKILVFLLIVSSAASWAWKVKYLNRYTELRELPGGKIRDSEGFDLHPDLANDTNHNNGFHNYLDEFLSAIKVFGYLEKPVFHELARHLQTRRLVAGDTLDLSKDKSFYIVVDGRVEVFAQNPSSPQTHKSNPPHTPFNLNLNGFEGGTEPETGDEGNIDDEEGLEGAGWQLLNCVESGGTLSSLFTILSLFTEEVKLRYEEDDGDREASDVRGPNGDVADFDLDSDGIPTPFKRPGLSGGGGRKKMSRDSGDSTEDADDERGEIGAGGKGRAANDTTRIVEEPEEEDADEQEESNTAKATPSFAKATASVTSPAYPFPTMQRKFSKEQRPSPFTAQSSSSRHGGGGGGGDVPRKKRSTPAPAATSAKQFETTLARATVDTTLAVIPAEAFRRLTKKFPNAAAHIVQVILTRLQRVTLLTAHKYLGLTREVIRTEEAINDLACYPLPNSFWENGGIQRLRARFVPETVLGGDEEEMEDYFGQAGESSTGSGNKRSGGRHMSNLGEHGHGSGSRRRDRGMPLETPYAGPRMGEVFWSDELDSSEHEGIRLKMRTPGVRRSLGSSNAGGTQAKSGGITRKTGDLLTMSSVKGQGSTPVGAPVPQTPRLERMRSGTRAITGDEEFDLRGAVMECISKAIGLVQPHVTPSTSVQASPSVGPHEYSSSPGIGSRLRTQAAFNSSFSSLSLLGLQGLHDDDSSVSSLSASGMFLGESGAGSRNFASMDLENEVEILYFPKDSMLVKEGERNAGLYFVIEGFLDVSMPDEGPIGGSGFNKQPRTHQTSNSDDHTTSRSTAGQKKTFSKPGFRDAKNKSVPFSSTNGSKTTTGPAPPQKKKSIPLFTVRPGGIAGYLSSLTGFPSYVDITAKTECYVGFLPAKALERIMDRKPIVLLTLAKRLISLLSPLVLHIDSALDWMHVSAGQVIYRPGDEADSFYIVINGRLRSITERQGGGVDVQAEYGQGDSVGELDCITASPRPSTLHAIRDTELARMPMTLFNAISVHHPLVTVQISRIIASRLRSQVMSQNGLGASLPRELGRAGASEGLMGKNNFNLKTVAIIPTNRHVPVSEFATKLHQALESIGAPTSYLNQATVMQVLGRHAFSRMGQLKLAGWLAENEQKYRIVLYVADTAVSAPWTQTCIRQADCIFVVADAGAEPTIGEHEKLLVGMKTTARKELVLLHAERFVQPGTTRPWLRNRPWIHAHHHVEMIGATPEQHRDVTDPAAVVALRKIAARVEFQISKYKKTNPRPIPQRTPASSDFARLARRLCGRSIGVVLGGGGARGISHIGVLRALSERSIPVDMIGGTSIGAFIGGLYAKEGDLVSTFGRTKRFSGRMSTLWRILTDLTYPVVAYTTGHEFNRGIYKSFYDTNIEDMWLPFFCNTTNITHSRMDVHTSGYAWRYVRASMSLAGLLPPLCDEGDMLVDGGYVDNLPVSVMLAQGASSVFAVDVGSVDDTDPRNYGESVSGWWLLVQRWNPFGSAPNIPSITEIQARLTYVSSVKTLEEAKNTPGVLYMRMPVTQFGTMEFKRFTEILQVGSEFSKGLLTDWDSKGELPTGLEGDITNQKAQKRGQSIRRNSI
ncbi:lysophospholipase [Sporobolomyces koalae]|uniref:lysophospholipase n=1 Tax=Sporobolomyces koalae TaxID=500713 RepID=UPI00316D4A9E